MTTTTETNLITLPTKPTAQLSYTFHPPSTQSSNNKILLVFLNGLAAPQTSWGPVIHHLQSTHPHNLPAILTYDRYGQGQTPSRDPADQDAPDPSHGHDILSALHDLHQLIQQIAKLHLHTSTSAPDLNLILVGNSLGCALARLYAQTYPGTVPALLLLDSILANSDFVSVFPDPTAPDFIPPQEEDGISAQDLIVARAIAEKAFHPSVGSKEGLSRRNLAELLPESDGPRLVGPDDERGPWVTVIGHDGKAFAEESVRMTGGKVSGRVFEVYVTPFWEKYHQGLLGITDEGRGRGPLVAEGAGHVVQMGNPAFVAEELGRLLDRVME